MRIRLRPGTHPPAIGLGGAPCAAAREPSAADDEPGPDELRRVHRLARSTEMTLDDYWTQILEKLAAVHAGFALDAERREELIIGDAALVRMASESLESERRFVS
jgi:hypothetical protein